jgi:orotate phosphoribosyltransferase-like protein
MEERIEKFTNKEFYEVVNKISTAVIKRVSSIEMNSIIIRANINDYYIFIGKNLFIFSLKEYSDDKYITFEHILLINKKNNSVNNFNDIKLKDISITDNSDTIGDTIDELITEINYQNDREFNNILLSRYQIYKKNLISEIEKVKNYIELVF